MPHTPSPRSPRPILVHLRQALGFTLINFATPIAFFLTFRAVGAKPAIGFAIAVTVVQLIVHRLLLMRPSPFFIVASGFTVLFGSIDLFLETPRFFRLEPFAQNALLGSVFLVTVVTGHSIASWFARGLPERFRPTLDESMSAYLRKLTLVWGVYFWLKGLVFLWLALRVDLGSLILLRSLIGGVSLAALIVGEIAYRKWKHGPRAPRAG